MKVRRIPIIEHRSFKYKYEYEVSILVDNSNHNSGLKKYVLVSLFSKNKDGDLQYNTSNTNCIISYNGYTEINISEKHANEITKLLEIHFNLAKDYFFKIIKEYDNDYDKLIEHYD